MKQFFSSFLGTIAGILISFLIVFLVGMAIIYSLVSSAKEQSQFVLKRNGVLHIKLDQEIVERNPKNFLAEWGISNPSTSIGLNTILLTLEKASADSNIKGIFLELTNVNTGMASLEEIRNGLLEFKKSGKFILSYSEVLTQKAYYLASIADKISLSPEGLIEWKGLSAEVLFFKGALDKLQIDPQIFRHGKFKSAIEPLDLTKMSQPNRQQTQKYVLTLWNHWLEGIEKSRKISVAKLNELADDILVQNAKDAVKYGLADDLKYKDEVLFGLKKRLGVEEDKKLNMVDFNDYASTSFNKKTLAKDKIAIIYSVGSIHSGEGDDNAIGSESLCKAIDDARMDNNVKAIVLRVNSPGGSALASDIIWRAVAQAEKQKPVVVSMGDVAASGGYYISCAADAIVAEPNTITGSIGVFGVLPNMEGFFNKLGITMDTVNTNKHSDIGNPFRPLSKLEGSVIQNEVENTYKTFISKVAMGRKIKMELVDSIGQGRVWSGKDAKAIGLVDQLGGIKEAFLLAAQKAKIKEYSIVELPIQENPFLKIFKKGTPNIESILLKEEFPSEYKYLEEMKETYETKEIQTRMPYEINVH